MSDLNEELFLEAARKKAAQHANAGKVARSFYECFNTPDGKIVLERLCLELRAKETDLGIEPVDLGAVVKRDTMRQVYHYIENMIELGEKGAS